MFKVSTVIVGLIILLIIFSRVASADYPCFADCPNEYATMHLGNIHWSCPSYVALNHNDWTTDCYMPVRTVMDANPYIGEYIWHGDIKHKSYMMAHLATKVRYFLIE